MLHPQSSFNRIRSILKKPLDNKIDLFQEDREGQNHIPDHENIRGEKHYLRIIQNNLQHESNHRENDSNAIKANGTNPSSKTN